MDGNGNHATLMFTGSASAGSSVQITNDGATASGAQGGVTIFGGNSSAGSATLVSGGGTNGGLGGATYFTGSADGGTASASIVGNGVFDISGLTGSGMNIGSIAASGTGGTFFLGSKSLTVGGNNLSTTFSGVLSDGGQSNGTGGSLAKVVGTGTLTLTGANTYTGTTTVSNGTPQIGVSGTAGSISSTSPISLNSTGILMLVNIAGSTFSNNVSNGLGGTGTLDIASASPNALVTVSGALTDGAAGKLAFTQNGSGTTVLTNANNTYSGQTTVSSGILQIGTASLAGSIGASSTVLVSNSATLSLVNVNGNTFTDSVANITGGLGTLNVNSANTITLSGALTDSSTGQVGQTGTLSLTQSGAGTTILTNTGNTYAGTTTISNGTLQVGTVSTAGSIGHGTITVTNNSTLSLVNLTGNVFASSVTNGTGGTVGTLLINSANAINLSGALTDGPGGQLVLTQMGPGTAILTNANNTYSGATTISNGTLQIGTTGTAGSLGNNTLVSVAGGTTLSLVNVSGNTFATSVTNKASGVGTISINSTNTTTLTGALTDGASGQLALNQPSADCRHDGSRQYRQ